MYIPTGIHQLSHEQIRKMLHGDAVRVKHGAGHEIHLSHEQHKKLAKAHAKGAGITLRLDPYQMHNHEHLRGHGFFNSVKKVAKSIAKNPLVQQLGKQSINLAVKKANASGYIPHGLADIAGQYAQQQLIHAGSGNLAHHHSHGNGFFNSVKKTAKSIAKSPILKSVAKSPILKSIAKEAIHYGAPMVGEAVGSMIGGPEGAMVGAQLASSLASSQGYGIKRHKKRSGKRGGALVAAGYGCAF